ncbi:MAG: 4-hydroxy-tetrahydrodipicolinate synthase [Candidatus Dadabacteria bacterium]|nr:4-hydroxy-tetrahydrodipicolinate synthase [Candidatus Dadabacteria bacterium]
MIEGSIVAIVTPFSRGRVDESALEKLVEFQIENGTHGIVACGTTGESPTLSHDEHEHVIELIVKMAGGRVPVIAGTGSNSTDEAVRLTRFAKKVGADGTLLVVPYYNKPTQDGLFRHFAAIADKVDIPIILYNVPGRTGVSLSPQTTAKLARSCKNIIGIKDATGSVQNASKTLHLTGMKFILLSGEDAINYPLLTVGGRGFITVTANVAPKHVSDLYNYYKKGKIEKARNLHYKLLELNEIMFIEANPIPVKTALYLMGMIKNEFRLPLSKMSKSHAVELKKVLKNYDLIK